MDDRVVSCIDPRVAAPVEEDDVTGLQVALVHGGPVSELLVGGARNGHTGLFVRPLNETGAVEGAVVAGAEGARDSDPGCGGMQCVAPRPHRRPAERVNQVISVIPGVWFMPSLLQCARCGVASSGRPITGWSRADPGASAELPGYVPVFSASVAGFDGR